jgi:hypothetical protein
MALMNQSVPAGLELGAIAPVNKWGTEERETGAQAFAAEATVEQANGCPLLRGIFIATIPALLMWATILELAAKLL